MRCGGLAPCTTSVRAGLWFRGIRKEEEEQGGEGEGKEEDEEEEQQASENALLSIYLGSSLWL